MTIRIKIQDRHVTMSGVPYDKLREVFTCAALNLYLRPRGRKDSTQYKEMKAYQDGLMRWLKLMEEAMSLAISNTYPPRPVDNSKAVRFKRVRESEKERALLDSLTTDVLSWSKERWDGVRQKVDAANRRDKPRSA